MQNKNQLIKRAKERSGLPLDTVWKAVNAFLYEFNHSLLRREKVLITHVGIFKVVRSNTRRLHSNLTDKTYVIPSKLNIKFTPSKAVKRLLNEERDTKTN